MNIANRVATRAGAYLKTRAERLAKFLFTGGKLRFVTKRQIMDGFLVEGKRAGNVGSYTVLDMPAYLTILGHYFDANIPFASNRCAVAQLPRGRDSYYEDGITELTNFPGDQILLAPVARTYRFGDMGDEENSYFAHTGIVGKPAPGNGAGYAYTLITPTPPQSESAVPGLYEYFADNNTRCLYCVNIVVPTFYKAVATAPDWQIVNAPADPTGVPETLISFRFSDSIFSSFGGSGFSKRSDPSNPVISWSAISRPWVSFSKPYYRTKDDGTQALIVVAWTNPCMPRTIPGSDGGVKGLWVGEFEITNSGARIISQVHFDPRDTDTYPAIRTDELGTQSYLNNYRLRSDSARLDSGTLVIVDPYGAETDVETGGAVVALYLRYVKEGQIGTLQLFRDVGVPDSPPKGGVCGCDTDGTTVVIPVFSGYSIAADGPTSATLSVFTATESSAQQVFEAQVPFTACWAAPSESVYSAAGFDFGGPRQYTSWFGNTFSAGGYNVRYIGDNKYAFICSSLTYNVPEQVQGGNIALAIYDLKANSVSLAGEIAPYLPDSDEHYFTPAGSLECPKLATDKTPATLIFTRGRTNQNGRFAEQRPSTDGETYISYDSGATWLKILDVGSPAGAFHAGNALAPRSEPVVKG